MKEISIKLPQYVSAEAEVLMSGKSSIGEEFAVNRKFFTHDGQPWFPITGEFHFSRYPSEYWKEALQMIKAGGLDTIATYVFWIHHEEIEGQFKWDGRFDVKRFIELCHEVGLKVILRIGPWDHGEVRNGGYPDWLLKKIKDPGTNDPEYFKYGQRLYTEIFNQVKHLFFKDNGPIIGIQIDNEYGHCHGLKGEEGRIHMMTLKKMALDTGFDVPFYTATGWGGAVVVEGEFLPLMAAYVEGSWEQHIDKADPNINYVFTSVRDDQTVGSDLAKIEKFEPSYNIENYPFSTCELGGGMQASYQRRAIITEQDTEGMAFVKLGSGAVMLGYYMYQGGTNPMGELTPLQETRATGFPNDLPKLTYDYQAPLGEYGQRNASYKALRRIHLFAKDQESLLASANVIIPNDKAIRPDDAKTLRYAVRYKDKTGFVFVNNYQHNLNMEPQGKLQFNVEVEDESIAFPPFNLESGEWRLLPFNLDLNTILLKCTMAQPLTSLATDAEVTYFYYGDAGQEVEFHFDSNTIKHVISFDGSSYELNDLLIIKQRLVESEDILKPIVLENQQGDIIQVVTLTREQASNINKLEIGGKDYMVLTEGDAYVDIDQIQIVSLGMETMDIQAYPSLPNDQVVSDFATKTKNSIFDKYHVKWLKVEPKVTFTELDLTKEGHGRYQLMVDPNFMEGCADVFLQVDFEGDIAELYQDQDLKADMFYNGLTWQIGLKRFESDLSLGDWILDISPLNKDAYVYLDKWPQMVEGSAMRLVKYKAIPEYRLL